MRLRSPPYVHAFVDRHGKARYYFRRNGRRIALPARPGSPEFLAAYEAALEAKIDERANVGAEKIIPGSINGLIVAYFNSLNFQNLAQTTKATYRGILEGFRVEHGHRSALTLDRRAVIALLQQKAATPAAAGNRLRMVRLLMRFALDQGWRNDDPTVGIKTPKTRSGGFHTWTEAEIAQFERHHPIGTRARLAFDLLLWTTQRRGDVVRIGKQHIKGGRLTIRQQKTGQVVSIPVAAELRSSIDALPNDHLTFLVTEFGKPFSPAGFGNWFREVCSEAGLRHCSAHGLRKAGSTRLAENGCTAHEIMAITGHKTLREVTRYTEAVDRERLADTAMAKIGKRTSSGKP
jgi:integrase